MSITLLVSHHHPCLQFKYLTKTQWSTAHGLGAKQVFEGCLRSTSGSLLQGAADRTSPTRGVSQTQCQSVTNMISCFRVALKLWAWISIEEMITASKQIHQIELISIIYMHQASTSRREWIFGRENFRLRTLCSTATTVCTPAIFVRDSPWPISMFSAEYLSISTQFITQVRPRWAAIEPRLPLASTTCWAMFGSGYAPREIIKSRVRKERAFSAFCEEDLLWTRTYSIITLAYD